MEDPQMRGRFTGTERSMAKAMIDGYNKHVTLDYAPDAVAFSSRVLRFFLDRFPMHVYYLSERGRFKFKGADVAPWSITDFMAVSR
jgi:hypothetical protein